MAMMCFDCSKRSWACNVVLAKRKMKSIELAKLIGITERNLSILKIGKAKAIRLSTLDAICKHLNCQPGDILQYTPTLQKFEVLNGETSEVKPYNSTANS